MNMLKSSFVFVMKISPFFGPPQIVRRVLTLGGGPNARGLGEVAKLSDLNSDHQ